MNVVSRWPVVPLGEVVAETQYGTSVKANETGAGVPVLRMNNITYSGALDLTNLKHVDLPRKDLERYSLRRGDLLFNRTNSQELVGKMGVWNCDESYAFAGYLVRLRLRRDLADPAFVAAWFNSPEMKTLLRSRAKPSINMSNISATEILKFPVVNPPLAEQRGIAEVLDRAEALRAKRRAAPAHLDTLVQAVFLDLFGDIQLKRDRWPIVPLEQIVTATKLGLVRGSQEFGPDYQFPYVRMNAITRNGQLDLATVQRTNATEAEVHAYRLEPGDLLFNTRNSEELVGKTALFREVGVYLFASSRESVGSFRFPPVANALISRHFVSLVGAGNWLRF